MSDPIDTILISLKDSKHRIRNYSCYPSYEFKQQQIKDIEIAEKWIKNIKINGEENENKD